jgi:hypothetical protein
VATLRHAFRLLSIFTLLVCGALAQISPPDDPTSPAQLPDPQLQPAPAQATPTAASANNDRNTQQGKVPGHIFFVIPAFNVQYDRSVPPLTSHEKFTEFIADTYDPQGNAVTALEPLLLEYSKSDGFCGYGNEVGGYAKCWGSALLDGNISGFFGDYLFPSWLHQDPRYFRLGKGHSIPTRILYSLSRVAITRADKTLKPIFDSSQLAGTVLAGFTSNLYYPAHDRGFGLTMSRIGIDLMGTTLFNLEAEFWQDIRDKFSGH